MIYYFRSLKKYADFEGRARLSEFVYFQIFHPIFIIFFAIIGHMIGIDVYYSVCIYSLGTFLPTLALIVRRFHDVGKSGWFFFVPIYSLILILTEGDKGENEYGPDPKPRQYH